MLIAFRGNMMKKLFRTPYLALVSLLAVNLLVGCQAKDGTTPVAQASATGTSDPRSVDGTTDSGGGNGVMEKVYESYAINPYGLPAYSQHLQKLFDSLEKAIPGAGFKAWLVAKTWYIAPLELKKIDKSILGLSFIDSETEQLAIQKPNSIWIKKDVFDRMTTGAQADLILHEYVMIMYLMKFKPYSTICKMINSKDCQVLGTIDKLWPAEAARALNEKDYENIRAVTSWLKDRRENSELKAEDVRAVLMAKEFDLRFLNPLDAKKEKPVIMSNAEFFDVVQAQALTGNPLNHCTAEETIESVCDVQIKKNDIYPINMPMHGIKAFNINVKNSNGANKNLNYMFGNDVTIQYAMTYKGQDYWTAFGIQLESVVKTGDPANIVVFILTRSTFIQESQFELQRIYIKPGVITSIDLKREQKCLVQKVKPSSFDTQSLVLHRQEDNDFWEQYLYKSLVPTAFCDRINVFNDNK